LYKKLKQNRGEAEKAHLSKLYHKRKITAVTQIFIRTQFRHHLRLDKIIKNEIITDETLLTPSISTLIFNKNNLPNPKIMQQVDCEKLSKTAHLKKKQLIK